MTSRLGMGVDRMAELVTLRHRRQFYGDDLYSRSGPFGYFFPETPKPVPGDYCSPGRPIEHLLVEWENGEDFYRTLNKDERKIVLERLKTTEDNILNASNTAYWALLEFAIKGQRCYYLSPSVAVALAETDPPTDIPISDVHWPMDAALLYLPESQKIAKAADGSYISWIMGARVNIAEIEEVEKEFEAEKKRLPAGMLVNPIDHWLVMGGSEKYSIWGRYPFRDGQTFDQLVQEYQDTSPTLQSQTIARIFFNALLLMQARPELLTGGEIVKVRRKKGQKTRVIRSPMWLGENYTRPFAHHHRGESHASPTMHWRRGHWRNQACGPGRRDHKMIWIEPMLVGGKDD